MGRNRRSPKHVALADACAHVLETLGTGAVHAAGHSMGGKVALWLALRHPALVRSLTLVDAAALATPGPVRRSFQFWAAYVRLSA